MLCSSWAACLQGAARAGAEATREGVCRRVWVFTAARAPLLPASRVLVRNLGPDWKRP